MADVLHGKNMTGKHQYQSLFLTKLDPACNFIKQGLRHSCIPVNFAKFLKALLLQSILKGCFQDSRFFVKQRVNKSFHKQRKTNLINWSVQIRKTQQLKVSLLRVFKLKVITLFFKYAASSLFNLIVWYALWKRKSGNCVNYNSVVSPFRNDFSETPSIDAFLSWNSGYQRVFEVLLSQHYFSVVPSHCDDCQKFDPC